MRLIASEKKIKMVLVVSYKIYHNNKQITQKKKGRQRMDDRYIIMYKSFYKLNLNKEF